IRGQLRQLGEAGVEVHGQIVLCPGWNDGEVLEQTLGDLAQLYPSITTVGIVPVGLTAHRPADSQVRAITSDDASAVLDTVDRWQKQFFTQYGTRFVFAADEFYLAAGHEVPPYNAYEDFAQKENGIGLARIFLDDAAALEFQPTTNGIANKHVTIATGTLAAPLLEHLASRIREKLDVTIDVESVPNLFYGGGVSVAGLLTGSDFIAAMRTKQLGDILLLPAVALNSDGIFLDDMTPEQLEQELHVPIRFSADPQDVLDAILQG
ncbi:MAG TPA: DUF512 domain-containing protein, partial [Armatimonadota bacterium]|nr:DUF512 domain-containing protein [Armatimonadota bacterium]